LEKLRGDREGQWSVRINQQYRVCFSFERGYAYDVDLEPLSMTAYQLAKASPRASTRSCAASAP
jgi:Txe/YoeB family toxin of Txe-Axe toxin-antitoxin module